MPDAAKVTETEPKQEQGRSIVVRLRRQPAGSWYSSFLSFNQPFELALRPESQNQSVLNRVRNWITDVTQVVYRIGLLILLFAFFAAIIKDLIAKNHDYLHEVEETIQSCEMQYYMNSCSHPVPAMVQICREWSLGMRSYPGGSSNTRILAEILADSANHLIARLNIQTVIATLTIFYVILCSWRFD